MDNNDKIIKLKNTFNKQHPINNDPLTVKEALINLLKLNNKIDFFKHFPDGHKIYNTDKVVLISDQIKDNSENGLIQINGNIFIYNSMYWSEVSLYDLKNFLTDCSCKAGIPKIESKKVNYRKLILEQFTDHLKPHIPQPKDEVCINLKNGTFVINKDKRYLREFRKTDYFTYQLPFEYKKDVDTPLFNKYVERVLPDKKSIDMILMYVGYALLKQQAPNIEKVLMLTGGGENGKSVMLNIISAIIGKENISNFSVKQLTDENGYYRAKIGGKILNYSSEIGNEMNSETFKQIASREPIAARLPHKDPFTVYDVPAMIFNANNIPFSRDNTHAYFRRLSIVPFNQTITPEEKDIDLADKIIKNELSGIFNKIIESISILLLTKKLPESKSSIAALRQHHIETDNVMAFISENYYVKSKLSFRPFRDVYEEYS